MKRTNLYTILFAVSMLFFFAAPASATDLNADTCSSIFHGVWPETTPPFIPPWGTVQGFCTVSDSVTINNDITIPEGVILSIESSGAITINGITITNNGGIDNAGTIIRCGEGSITGTGTIIGNIPSGPREMHKSCQTSSIPEFPTLALPIASVIGLMFFIGRRKKQR